MRSFDLLRKFALTLNSKTPHKKKSKGLQSGDLGGQTSYIHTSPWSSPASSCCLGQECNPDGRCNSDFHAAMLVHPSTLSSHNCFGNVHLPCAALGGGRGETCRGPWWWARRGWRPGRFPFFLLKLYRFSRSSRSDKTFFQHRKQWSYWCFQSS
jgi:hypothetical protein